MTALVASFGFVLMAIPTAEVRKFNGPLAAVVIGGLITLTSVE